MIHQNFKGKYLFSFIAVLVIGTFSLYAQEKVLDEKDVPWDVVCLLQLPAQPEEFWNVLIKGRKEKEKFLAYIPHPKKHEFGRFVVYEKHPSRDDKPSCEPPTSVTKKDYGDIDRKQDPSGHYVNPFQIEQKYREKSISFVHSQDKKRHYVVYCNMYPIFDPYFVFVSTERDKPQYIDAKNIMCDLLDVVTLLPEHYMVGFNCNNAGNTCSGASINVWHAHIANMEVDFSAFKLVSNFCADNTEIGYYKNNKGSCRIFKGRDAQELSTLAFDYISVLNKHNNSYNVIFTKEKSGKFLVVIFIRGDWDTQSKSCQLQSGHIPGFVDAVGCLVLSKSICESLKKTDINQTDIIINEWLVAASQREDVVRKFDMEFYENNKQMFKQKL